ncbi:hypothetical protein LX64_03026 [Chitinophaga skermanii]|uniref:T9SS C-terminal target domain-containing protein n=1 Tax=Chitinophaga skermanii TaxID=331697 RepID=A0A327QJI6_9BACT|nr:hypothetical protein [Chitinophaga skermanii]RAJ04148.1 hypothetical protein LX64_03026 [Chitinophaga skermanii]
MRKLLFASAAVLSVFASCSDDKNDTPKPPTTGSGDTVMVRGVMSTNTTWSANKVYKLRGYTYVAAGAKLTIEAGTKIISTKDSAGVLVIAKGATIDARGTSEKPIVFTSGEKTKTPGDLGGVIVAGAATWNNNHTIIEGAVDDAFKNFGGSNDADNSGYLQYIRIEYAGKAVAEGDEVNGLSLYAVGSGTTVDHIQIVRGLDDAFEFFGGTVNAKYLIAYNCADDDFDFDDGYRGKIQFAVSVKDPAFVDNKGTSGDISNNFEFDNSNGKKEFTITPNTFPIMSNFTAIGPNNATGTRTEFGYGMRMRRGAKFLLANSIVAGGQKAGLDIDNDSTASYYKQGISGLKNSILHAVTKPFNVDLLNNTALLTATDLQALVTGRDATLNVASASDIQLTDAFNNAAPNLAPKSGSPALTRGTKFEGQLNDAFFSKVSYIGAVDPTNDWTKASWTVWNK